MTETVNQTQIKKATRAACDLWAVVRDFDVCVSCGRPAPEGGLWVEERCVYCGVERERQGTTDGSDEAVCEANSLRQIIFNLMNSLALAGQYVGTDSMGRQIVLVEFDGDRVESVTVEDHEGRFLGYDFVWSDVESCYYCEVAYTGSTPMPPSKPFWRAPNLALELTEPVREVQFFAVDLSTLFDEAGDLEEARALGKIDYPA